jgi:type II secretory pathway component PulF
MATFQYTALKRDGSRSEGSLNALDRSDAFRRLGRQGLQPVKLNETGSATVVAEAPPKKQAEKAAPGGNGEAEAKSDSKSTKAVKPKGRLKGKFNKEQAAAEAAKADAKAPKGPIKLKRAQVVMFTEELAEMLAAGLQLEPALRVMESREELSNLKDVTVMIRQEVRDGASFSKALEKSSPSFGPLYCSMAHAGEVSGALPKILRRQAEHLVTMQELQGKVLFALIYPAFLVFAGIAVTLLFVVYLIPQLMGLMNSTGGDMPAEARALIATSDFFKSYWWALILGIGGIVVTFRIWLRKRENRAKWDRFIVTVPLIGGVLSSRFYVQCMETLANLVGNGMPLLKGLELTRDTTMNMFLREKITHVAAIVGEGGALSRAMKKVGFFPALLIDMVSVGEQTGDLESSLERAAGRYDKELAKTIEKISALVQPVIVFIMAGVVGTMAYMMISIIFDTVSSLGGPK